MSDQNRNEFNKDKQNQQQQRPGQPNQQKQRPEDRSNQGGYGPSQKDKQRQDEKKW